LLAFKSWVRRNDVMHPDKSSGADDVRSELKAKS